MLRMFIPDPTFFHPGSEFFPSRIPDLHKEFNYFNPKKWFLSSKYPDPDFLHISDPGVKKALDPGSAKLVGINKYLCFVIEVLGHIQDVRKIEGGVEFLLSVVLHVELEPV